VARGEWQWRLTAAVLVGMGAGFGAAWLIGLGSASVQAGIVAGFTAAAGSKGALRTAVPVAGLVGSLVVLSSSLGAATTGYPWAAAAAMAAVAFATSVLTAAVPVGLLIGMVVSYSYFLTTAIGVLVSDAVGHDLDRIGLLGAVGLATGLALVAVRAGVEQLLGTASPRRGGTPASPTRAPLIAPIVTALRTFDVHARDGVRRAVALGVAMLVFQYQASHGAFWVMLTVFVILQPNGRSTLSSAIVRVTGTIAGVLVVALLSPLLPDPVAVGLAILCVAGSIAASTKSSTVSAGLGAVAASVLAGVPSGNVLAYAGLRLLDTVVGAAIAIVAGYLLWPRQRPVDVPVPDDLAGTASAAGLDPRRSGVG
jgi:hypothetical protein